VKPDLSILPARERVVIEPRKPLTKAPAMAILVRDGIMCGCGKCDRALDPFGEGVIDEHVIRLDMGGTNALSNRRIYRKPCAAAKTTAEAKPAAKVKRLAGETCTAPTKRPLKGPKFSVITRKFNGTHGPTPAARREGRG